MFNSLYHAEIGGGYTLCRKIIINAADLRPLGGQIEVAAIIENGDELNSTTVTTEAAALAAFHSMIQQYAEPLQKAVDAAGLVPGRKYTLVYFSEFGFPIAEKITFHDCTFTTYAQHADVVRLTYTPYRKRSLRGRLFCGCSSLLIFNGWQDLPKQATSETLKKDEKIKITRSKYESFSASYIEDAAALLADPVLIFKSYQTGANGKVYA